eukprot:Gb_02844 [translate_table: standard]
MHLTAWKPIFPCSAVLFDKKKRRSNVVEPKKNPATMLRKVQENRIREALEEASEDGSLHKSQILMAEMEMEMEMGAQLYRSTSSARLTAQTDFLKAIAQAANIIFNTEEAIPGLEEAYAKFKNMYPEFEDTEKVDQLRYSEYNHLQHRKVCLDYCGFGLFSFLQQMQDWEASSFGLSQISVNLSSYAMHGVVEQGSVESDLRNRIMDFLSIPRSEYTMVFTSSRGSAFKLLAGSYPFHQNRRLLTMYDYESESVNWMGQSAREKGAKLRSAWFRWPTLGLCSTDLRKQLRRKRNRKKESAVGLFVFPVQSRVTGAKYSYQWMSLAQQNGWHVLLDAGALGPKDMDSLGLSLFSPDFIITSFYKVFGGDPTGFGCLFIKKSVMGTLENHDGAPDVGMVRIFPLPSHYYGDSADAQNGKGDDSGEKEDQIGGFELPAFSGPFSALKAKDVFESEIDYNSCRDGVSTNLEDMENASVGEVIKSPMFSEDENENLFCIDLGQSPPASHSADSSRGSPFTKQNSSDIGFSHTKSHNRLFTRSQKNPLYDHDSSVRSDELDLPKDGSDGPTLFSEISIGDKHSQSEKTGTDPSLLHRDTNGKLHKFELLEPGESPFNGEQKIEMNGSNEMGSSGRIGSRRFPKQNKLAFILENQETAEADRVDSPIPEPIRTLPGQVSEITACNEDTKKHAPNGSFENGNSSLIVSKRQNHSPKHSKTKENAIRRETEGEFRLLDRRERGRHLGIEEVDRIGSMGRRVSFSMEEESGEEWGGAHDEDGETAEEKQWGRREPIIILNHLDHINSMSLNKTSLRLRYLINWLVTSLLQLRHPGPDGGIALVHIYGPKIKYDRGAAVAFNLFNSNGLLVSPELVQKLAEKNNIALGLGFLSHLRLMENASQMQEAMDSNGTSICKPLANGRHESKNTSIRAEVVTASLGFLTNFEDIYRMWAFAAKFLDADFAGSQFESESTQ